jgi:hypothetical protein
MADLRASRRFGYQLTKQLLGIHMHAVWSVLPAEMINDADVGGTSASADAPVRPTITQQVLGTGLHPMQETYHNPDRPGHQHFASVRWRLGPRPGISESFCFPPSGKVSNGAKAQTESIHQLYQDGKFVAVAITTTAAVPVNNTGNTKRQQSSMNFSL